MDAATLVDLVQGGENSFVQLKEDVRNVASIAQEMIAFANASGGKIIIGVNDKTGAIVGLSFSDIQRINNLLTTAAQEHVKTPIIIQTETVSVGEHKVIVVQVPEGTDKPHMDATGTIFIKNGSDKRRLTSKEELSRLLQSSGNLYAEERLIQHSDLEDFDWPKFAAFYEKKFQEVPDIHLITKYYHNFHFGKGDKLNVAGALLFGKNLSRLLPNFYIAAVWFAGNHKGESVYRSSENLTGSLNEQYRQAYDFIRTKLNYVQGDQSFNSVGKPEVPLIVFQELLVNALIHRDYFINDSIKVFMFQDRIEIISPGKLPNSLTVDQMRVGIRKSRNFVLAAIGSELMEYKGIGSGIVRALLAYPDITLINDTEAEQFTAIIKRPVVL